MRSMCKFSFYLQEPLNSEDDVSDEEGQELFDTENVVVCQYDKVQTSFSVMDVCVVVVSPLNHLLGLTERFRETMTVHISILCFTIEIKYVEQSRMTWNNVGA